MTKKQAVFEEIRKLREEKREIASGLEELKELGRDFMAEIEKLKKQREQSGSHLTKEKVAKIN